MGASWSYIDFPGLSCGWCDLLFIFILAFGLEIVANSSDIVGRPNFAESNGPLFIGYSFIIPYRIPSTRYYLPVILCPDHTNSLVIFVAVVACNHLMLSLRDAAGRPNSTERPSYSLSRFSRPTTDVIFIQQASDITGSNDDQPRTILPAEHDVPADWNHKQSNLGQNPGSWHEIQFPGDSAARVMSFEKD